MEYQLLKDITIIFALSVLVIFIFSRIKIPSIIGFLITGMLAGPHGLGLIQSVHDVEILAELGVVLLLFTIGIEFSLGNLLQIRRAVLLGGSLQVLLTIGSVACACRAFGLTVNASIFIGFLVSLSSTAIVLRLIQDRAEIGTPYGRTALAILIFQDIAIVPMILLAPILSGAAGNPWQALFFTLLKGIAVIAGFILAAKWIIPKFLYQVARTRSSELFLLTVILLCLSIAWLTSHIGLSPALGAFLAGLVISESEYSHQAFGNILPFRDAFTSFFFVSIGMLLNSAFVLSHPLLVTGFFIIVILIKTLFAGISSFVLGFPLRTALMVGLSISQIGEFSFILARAGMSGRLLTEQQYQLFLAVTVISMAATPFIVAMAPRITSSASNLPLLRKLNRGPRDLPRIDPREINDHLIIVGFGINGKNVAGAAKSAGIPYTIIEMNPDTVRRESANGEPIHYGDASQEAILRHARIDTARVMVVAIADSAATFRITEVARHLSPKLYLIVRTRFIQDMQELYLLGASEVIPEEFETSVEIFVRVLAKYLVPRNEIERLVGEVRSDGYEMFRSLTLQASAEGPRVSIPSIDITTIRVPGNCPAEARSIGEIDLRKNYGATVLAIGRGDETLSNPGRDVKILAGDTIYLLVARHDLPAVEKLFTKC